MKQTFTAILIISLALIFSCNNNSTIVLKNSKADTIKTLALYRIGDEAYIEFVYRIVKDTFKFNQVDSLTSKKQWLKDSIYYVPNPDSAKAGKLSWAMASKDIILVDGGKNVDSIFLKYKLHFPKPDSTKK